MTNGCIGLLLFGDLFQSTAPFWICISYFYLEMFLEFVLHVVLTITAFHAPPSGERVIVEIIVYHCCGLCVVVERRDREEEERARGKERRERVREEKHLCVCVCVCVYYRTSLHSCF